MEPVAPERRRGGDGDGVVGTRQWPMELHRGLSDASAWQSSRRRRPYAVQGGGGHTQIKEAAAIRSSRRRRPYADEGGGGHTQFNEDRSRLQRSVAGAQRSRLPLGGAQRSRLPLGGAQPSRLPLGGAQVKSSFEAHKSSRLSRRTSLNRMSKRVVLPRRRRLPSTSGVQRYKCVEFQGLPPVDWNFAHAFTYFGTPTIYTSLPALVLLLLSHNRRRFRYTTDFGRLS